VIGGLVAFGAAGITACASGPVEPIPVSYLAIVSLVTSSPGVSVGTSYTYRVSELSGTVGVDTVIHAAPSDTIVLAVPPATYEIRLQDFPLYCAVRRGTEQQAIVFDPPSTTLARYHVECSPSLAVQVETDGSPRDDAYVLDVAQAGSPIRTMLVSETDTALIDNLPEGRYDVRLRHVAENCVIVSDGGGRRVVDVLGEGGSHVRFLVSCSDPAHRPAVLDFSATYVEGTSAFYARVTDPDRDVERYAWDLTDCAGTSVLPGGARTRRGLMQGRTRLRDTIEIAAAFEAGVPDEELQGRCTALRVLDDLGNTTPVLELPIRAPSSAPVIRTLNARLRGVDAVITTLEADDADGDLIGTFVAARLRDGVLGEPDGNSDIGVYNAAGYLGTIVPELPLTSRIQYSDVYSVIVYVIDRRGNVRRAEDANLFF
jgi:hypothetical protein